MSGIDGRPLERPWYRQFWPWFVAALPATAVVASLLTVWIAVDARPDRIDGYGALAVAVEFAPDRRTLRFDLGLPDLAAWRPQTIEVRLTALREGGTIRLDATKLDERSYQAAVGPIEPGRYDLLLRSPTAPGGLRGNWSYPAPVWKLVLDE